MDTSEEYSSTLLEEVEKVEAQARLRAILLTLIPAIFAVALLIYTGNQLVTMTNALVAKQKELVVVETQLTIAEEQLSTAESQVQFAQDLLVEIEDQRDQAITELEKVQAKLETVQAELDALKEQETETNQRLEELTQDFEVLQGDYAVLDEEYINLVNSMRDVSGSAFSGNPLFAIKSLANTGDYLQSEMLAEMLFDHRNARWNPGGYSPEEGFDSPSYATFMLEKYFLLPGPGFELRYQLREVLPSANEPNIGDVVFYERGYTMFYYEDENGDPFVVGMTPLGVLALEPDFIPVLGYGRVRN